MHGDAADWTLQVELLASLCDATQVANWQRAEGQGSRPKPIPRPRDTSESGAGQGGIEEARKAQAARARQRDDVISQEEFDKRMFGIKGGD